MVVSDASQAPKTTGALGAKGTSAAPAMTLVEVTAALRNVALLKSLPPGEIAPLAKIANARELAPGEAVFLQGGAATFCSFVVRGELVVRNDGREVTKVGAGVHLGIHALTGETKRQASIIATSTALVVDIDAATLRALMAKYPTFKSAVEANQRQRAQQLSATPR